MTHPYMTRRHLSVTGPDATDFLQNLTTAEVTDEPIRYMAILTPQGKFLADFFIRPIEGGYALDLDAAAYDGLFARLSMYKLRADVTLGEITPTLFCGTGTRPEGALPDPRDAAMGWRHYEAQTAGDDGSDWDSLRITYGIPHYGMELTPDSYILEMGFERLGGVSFTKGCYVGQEVTARMHHKTTLQKGLARIDADAPLTQGMDILSDGKPVGQITTVSGTRGLAYVNFKRLGDGQAVAIEGETAIPLKQTVALF